MDPARRGAGCRGLVGTEPIHRPRAGPAHAAHLVASSGGRETDSRGGTLVWAGTVSGELLHPGRIRESAGRVAVAGRDLLLRFLLQRLAEEGHGPEHRDRRWG